MANRDSQPSNETLVRRVLEQWAESTRASRLDDILAHHAKDALIFDVLPPMKHESAEAYRKTWEDWQPRTQGEVRFDLKDLSVVADEKVAYAHSFIHCGGVLLDGRAFDDLVRATFCLRKQDGAWRVTHQHISKPFQSNATP